MKHTAKLRQLPVHTYCSHAHAADTLPFVGGLLVHDMVFGAIKLVTKGFGHPANCIGELIDHRIEERYGRRKAFAAFDRAPVTFNRMPGALPRGD